MAAVADPSWVQLNLKRNLNLCQWSELVLQASSTELYRVLTSITAVSHMLQALQYKELLQLSAASSALELRSDSLLCRAREIRALLDLLRVKLMCSGSRPRVFALLCTLLLLQALQGIGAIEVTVDVRRCRQHLAGHYYSDPLSAWPCSNHDKKLDAAKTAVVVVDMWDFHHCPSEDCVELQLVL